MMKTPWLLLLLGLGVFPSYTATNDIELTSEETALPSIEEEGSVLILKKSNFDRALKENRYLLVEFYVALSGPSQTLAAEFAKAAEELKSTSVDVRLGKVDVTDQKDFKKEFNIQDFPTLKFFVDGNRSDPIDCRGVREAPAFVTWVRRRIGSCTARLNSTDQAKAFIDPEGLSVIGFLKSPHGGVGEVFCNSARSTPELPFGITSSDEVFAHFGIREDTIVIFQKGKPVYNEAAEEGKLNDMELTRLIKTFTLDLVSEYNLETSVKIFDVPVENHILLFIPKSSTVFEKAYEDFKTVALEFRGKIMFILVDTDETRNGRVIEYFQVIEIETPAVQILNLTSDARYKMPAERVTVKNLRSFCQSYLEGMAKVDPYKGEHTLDAFAEFLEEKIKTEKKASSKTKKKDVKKEAKITRKEEL